MNYVGHIAAALASGEDGDGPDEQVLVGSALPDFSAMARVRLRPTPDGAYAGGIGVHHRADAAFHALPWFRDATSTLRRSLIEAGMPPGPARAAAHVLPELALDGRLHDRPGVAHAVAVVLERVAHPDRDLLALVDDPSAPRWADGLRAIGTRARPDRYRDPAWVARGVIVATSGRRRIEVAPDHAPLLEREAERLLTDPAVDPDVIVRSVLDG